jgi:hypothetical protein
MQDAAVFLLMYVVFPLWVAAGLADWACHVRTGIAQTSGLKENALHWLMFAEIGVGMIAVAFFEIDTAVLAIVLAVFLVHEATVYWDLHYSTMIRDVGPFEQMVHSFLELLPLASLALLAVIAWPIETFDASLRLKDKPWSQVYVACAIAATVLFNALPLAQETVACLRARRRSKSGRRIEPRMAE